MSIIQRPIDRHQKTSSRRRRRTFQPGMHPIAEGLESRLVLSSVMTSPSGAVAAAISTATITSSVPLTLSHINLTGFTTNSAGQTVATGTASGTLLNSTLGTFTAPISLWSTPNAADPTCPILHLSLGPVNLNLLGLNVKLDNCANGPITLDITAHSGQGQLLGNLLCDIANLLNKNPTNGLLNQLNDSLNSSKVLSGLSSVLSAATNPLGQASAVSSASCSILDLHINPINLNLLGLQVQTSAICLNISATPGTGNLLGNLLCSIADVFNGTTTGDLQTLLTQLLITDLQNGIA